MPTPRSTSQPTMQIFSKFFGDCISRTAIRFACGNLFAMRNGERLPAGEEYQVFVIRGVDKGDMDVKGVGNVKRILPSSRYKHWPSRFGSEQ